MKIATFEITSSLHPEVTEYYHRGICLSLWG